MANGIYNAVSGAVAQSQVLDAVANNLANVSTVGFKGSRVTFSEVLAKASANGRSQAGSFPRPIESRMDLRPGSLQPTGNSLDLALEGKGYLCVQDRNGPAYTRGGALQIRTDGVLADADGAPLLGRDDRVIAPGLKAGELTIDDEGRVRNANGLVGVLKLVEFDRPASLQRRGANKVAAPASAGERPARETRVRQGHLEASNVNAVSEISSMIVASRSYEVMHRVISTFRDIDTRTANDLGGER